MPDIAVGAPRPVFCAIASEHRNVALANAACAGRFRLAGRTVALSGEPDWMRDPVPEDEEVRIEWSKFYYGLDLAHAYRSTGEPQYFCTWERLVESWIRQVPVHFDSTDVTGRRIQNWIYAWQTFARAEAFHTVNTDLPSMLIESLGAQVAHVRSHLTPERNHRTLELYALFIAALALPVLDPDGGLLPWAIAELHDNLQRDILLDGVHRERSTHYHMIVLRSFVGVMENARRFEICLPPGFAERVARACEFAMHCHRPDGSIPALSDSDGGSYRDLLAIAGRALRRPEFLYAASAGREGFAPRRACVSFPVGGYHIQRSGWGGDGSPFEDARYLIFDCGPVGDGGHGHYDALNIEVAAYGRPLILDPGRYTYAEGEPNWRRWFKGTAAHNTVSVDGLDQTPYRRGKPKGPVANCQRRHHWSAPGLNVVAADVRSPAYGARHRRTILFVDGAYWLVHDHLRDREPHRYELRYHLAPAAWGAPALARHADGVDVTVPGCVLHVRGNVDAVTLEPGWVAPEYGVKHPAPVISIAAKNACTADFVTAIVPQPIDRPAHLEFELARKAGGRMLAVLEHPNATPSTRDVVAWGNEPVSMTLGPVACTAGAGWLRLTDEQPTLFRGCQVHELPAEAPAGVPDFPLRVRGDAVAWSRAATVPGRGDMQP